MKENDEPIDNSTTSSGITVTKEKNNGMEEKQYEEMKYTEDQQDNVKTASGLTTVTKKGVEYNTEAQENTAHNEDNKKSAYGLTVQENKNNTGGQLQEEYGEKGKNEYWYQENSTTASDITFNKEGDNATAASGMTVGQDIEEDGQTNILGLTVEVVIIQEEDNNTETSEITVRGDKNNNQKEDRKQGEKDKNREENKKAAYGLTVQENNNNTGGKLQEEYGENGKNEYW